MLLRVEEALVCIMGRKITEHLAQLKHFILSTSDTGLISEKVLNF